MAKSKCSPRTNQVILAWVFATPLVACIAGFNLPAHAFGPATIINGASYGTLGSFHVLKVNVTNYWASPLDLVVFAVWKNTEGRTVAIGTGGLTLASGATGITFAPLMDELQRGSYTVGVFVVTTNNNPVSLLTSFSMAI